MAEMKDRIAFNCSHELALQIEERYAEFNGKYVVGSNMEKFSRVYDFFCNIVDDEGGEVVSLDVHPESACASVSIEISLLDLYKETMIEFVDILQYVDVFEVKPSADDSLLVCASVSHVWEE